MSVLTRAGAVPVLSLRDKRAANRPSILNPFFRCFFGAGQPSGPHQSRESPPSVKPEPPPIPFSSLLPPHSRCGTGHDCRLAERAGFPRPFGQGRTAILPILISLASPYPPFRAVTENGPMRPKDTRPEDALLARGIERFRPRPGGSAFSQRTERTGKRGLPGRAATFGSPLRHLPRRKTKTPAGQPTGA